MSKENAKNIEFTACQVGGGWSDGLWGVCVWGVLTKCAVYKCVQNLYVLRINLETLVAGLCGCVGVRVCVCTGVCVSSFSDFNWVKENAQRAM